MSLTYGSDYTITNQDENRDIFSLKLANNLRLEENDDFEKIINLDQKHQIFLVKSFIVHIIF